MFCIEQEIQSSANTDIEIGLYLCGINIVGGGSMFVSSVDNLCPRIYIPPNIYTTFVLYYFFLNYLVYQRNYLPTNQENVVYLRTLTPHEKKYDSTVICLKHFAILFMYFLIPHLSFCILFSRSKRESDKQYLRCRFVFIAI